MCLILLGGPSAIDRTLNFNLLLTDYVTNPKRCESLKLVSSSGTLSEVNERMTSKCCAAAKSSVPLVEQQSAPPVLLNTLVSSYLNHSYSYLAMVSTCQGLCVCVCLRVCVVERVYMYAFE